MIRETSLLSTCSVQGLCIGHDPSYLTYKGGSCYLTNVTVKAHGVQSPCRKPQAVRAQPLPASGSTPCVTDKGGLSLAVGAGLPSPARGSLLHRPVFFILCPGNQGLQNLHRH